MIRVQKIKYNSPLYFECLRIRKIVFVKGQNVPEEDEVDQYEKESSHFLADWNDIHAGAARWRIKDDIVKLERFAVLEEYRQKGIATELVKAVLEDIKSHTDKPNLQLLLHSQIPAIPLYKKFGFKEEGEIFDECGILHRKMSRML